MKEEEIRPKDIFDEYLRLAEIDAKKYFLETEHQIINCPACNSKGEYSFQKSGFKYEVCKKCDTLFVNPRPTAESFNKYYQESESASFWANTFYKLTAEARREKLWKPKAKKVLQIILKYTSEERPLIVDIGGGYGIFSEEIQALINRPPTVVEPGPLLAEVCRKKGFKVIEKFLEQVEIDDLTGEKKFFVSFELFEHLHNPLFFLKNLERLMNKGDLFIFTTLSGVGADIQALWNDSKSISPPHHINFFNPYSAKLIIEKAGLSLLEVSTPGKLDVDILLNNKNKIKDRFLKTLIHHSSKEQRNSLQEWLSSNGFSSHMWLVCTK